MEEGKLNHNAPEEAEAKRLAEMKSLSYGERLERLFALMEITSLIQKAKTVQLSKNEGTNS